MSILLASVAGGCGLIYEYDDCPADDIPLVVDADWMYAPDADPAGMAYIFFNNNKGVWRFDFPGLHGGDIALPEGSYSMLTLNDDTPGVNFKNIDDFSQFECYCRKGGLFDGLGGTIDNPIGPMETESGEEVNICPDMIWSYAYSFVGINKSDITLNQIPDPRTTGDNSMKIIAYPRQVVANYSFSVYDIKNLCGVKKICASLSGMSSSMRLSDCFRSEKTVTLPIAVEKDGEDSASGQFFTFGTPANHIMPNMFSLYVWLYDGRKLSYVFDVSEQIIAVPDPLNVHFSVSGIDLPESEPGGNSSFDVSVDGWTTIVIDIRY